jgi:hypothetical protein
LASSISTNISTIHRKLECSKTAKAPTEVSGSKAPPEVPASVATTHAKFESFANEFKDYATKVDNALEALNKKVDTIVAAVTTKDQD